jgi:hypothetical protein
VFVISCEEVYANIAIQELIEVGGWKELIVTDPAPE